MTLVANGRIASGAIIGQRSQTRERWPADESPKAAFNDTSAGFGPDFANSLVYSVAAVEPAYGEGDLHCGLGLLMPGRIGPEYFMTRGHLHGWREAAEFYIGLAGQGVMLLEEESSGDSVMVELGPNRVVYVPGRTAHRTINVGPTPLSYLGVYPAKAGHDYEAMAKKNFRCVIVERNGRPAMIERKDLLRNFKIQNPTPKAFGARSKLQTPHRKPPRLSRSPKFLP